MSNIIIRDLTNDSLLSDCSAKADKIVGGCSDSLGPIFGPTAEEWARSEEWVRTLDPHFFDEARLHNVNIISSQLVGGK